MSSREYAQSWLELEKALGSRPVLKGSVEEIRAQTDQLVEMLLPQLPPPSDAVETKDGDVDGVKYRIYIPKEASKKGPLPVGIYTHGGGYVVGDINTDDLLVRILAEHTPGIFVNVDYRLAPERKWSSQLEDTLSVFKWAHKNAHSFGGDPSKFFTIGGSAGGALALQVANRLVSSSTTRSTIKGIVAAVPATVHYDHVPSEYKSMYTAYEENAVDVPIIDKASMETFYAAVGAKPDDPSAFTLLATENHEHFPPTYMCSCEFDPLRDDARVMEKALEKKGVKVKSDHYPGFPHYFWIFPSVPEGQEFVGKYIGGIQWVIGQM